MTEAELDEILRRLDLGPPDTDHIGPVMRQQLRNKLARAAKAIRYLRAALQEKGGT